MAKTLQIGRIRGRWRGLVAVRLARELSEDVMRAQGECMTSWEMEEANRAWDERREVRFYPPPGTSRP